MSPSSAEVASSSSSKRRILQEGAGDGDPLPLPSRQAHAAIADERVEAFRQLGDELAAVRRVRGLPDLVVAGLGARVADVLDQRAVEQRDVLRHDRDGLAQALLRDLGDVLPVDQDAPRLDVVEALQEREERGFAAAGGADETDALARCRCGS